jgi:CRISPR system Cascade subunit CasE
MYLTQLVLNPRLRLVQRDLANPYQLHRTIMSAFPSQLPSDERVLFRMEIHPRHKLPFLLVQSIYQPNWHYLPAGYLTPPNPSSWPAENPATKETNLTVQAGQVLRFRLRANPTVKRQKKRYGLYREDEQHAWMHRKAMNAGCELLSLNIRQESYLKGWKPEENGQPRRLEFYAVTFEGVLRVQNTTAIQQALRNGIGSGKGLGFGLLSLAPADKVS